MCKCVLCCVCVCLCVCVRFFCRFVFSLGSFLEISKEFFSFFRFVVVSCPFCSLSRVIITREQCRAERSLRRCHRHRVVVIGAGALLTLTLTRSLALVATSGLALFPIARAHGERAFGKSFLDWRREAWGERKRARDLIGDPHGGFKASTRMGHSDLLNEILLYY